MRITPPFIFPSLQVTLKKNRTLILSVGQIESSSSVYFSTNLQYGLHLETLMDPFDNTYFQF